MSNPNKSSTGHFQRKTEKYQVINVRCVYEDGGNFARCLKISIRRKIKILLKETFKAKNKKNLNCSTNSHNIE